MTSTSKSARRKDLTLSLNRARRHLKEQAFLELTEIEHASEGREGAFLLHRLMAEPEIMIEGLDRANH